MSQHTFNRTPMMVALGCSLSVSFASAEVRGPRLEEVIVTAQKYEENIQAVPLAITAIAPEELEKKGITSLDGIAKTTPSISFAPFPSSSTTLSLFMRGQGMNDAGNLTGDPAVGLYVDGFYISRPQSATFDIADIERVEVLRGPQGALYGRNTTGGAVNLISKAPTGEFGFKQNLSFGSRDMFRSLTAIDFPSLGGVSTKITALKSEIDGYVKNTGSGHDFGEKTQLAGRFSLRWEVNSEVTIDYFLEKGELDSTPYYIQVPYLNGQILFDDIPYYAKSGPQKRSYRAVDLDISTSDFEGHGLTISWDVSDALTIRSLTGYRELNYDALQDYVEAFGFPFMSQDVYHQNQFSQEFQFIGSFLSNFNYVAGLYYFSEDGSHFNINDIHLLALPVPLTTTRYVTADASSKAIFGQLTWAPKFFNEELELTIGGRYTKDHKEAERTSTTQFGSTPPVTLEDGAATGARNSKGYSRFNPSFTANYRWTDDVSTYAKVSTGYRAGGSVELSPLGRFNQTFSPEDLVSYEVGLKSYWFDHRVRLNAAYFDSKIEDMQMVLPVDPNQPGDFQAFNAGEATIRGLELELLIAPIDDLRIDFNYTRLDASFDKVEAIAGTIFDQSQNSASPYQAGDNIKDAFYVVPYTPKHSYNLSFDYTFFHFSDGNLSARLDYRWQSRLYQSSVGRDVPNREYGSVPSYGVLNGRISAEFDLPRGDRARVGLWYNNLLNKDYALYAGALGRSFPIHSTLTGTTTPAGFYAKTSTWAEPPSYGIDIVYEY